MAPFIFDSLIFYEYIQKYVYLYLYLYTYTVKIYIYTCRYTVDISTVWYIINYYEAWLFCWWKEAITLCPQIINYSKPGSSIFRLLDEGVTCTTCRTPSSIARPLGEVPKVVTSCLNILDSHFKIASVLENIWKPKIVQLEHYWIVIFNRLLNHYIKIL